MEMHSKAKTDTKNVTSKRKVAGYARVSTDQDEQFSSFTAQVEYYTKYIENNPMWQMVEVYTDEGISGTNTKKREGFNRMIEDALAGKIDLIVTKSISRFARNTVDTLTTIRKLKDNGVEVYFEKENIWTFDSKGELLITIMSSLAQEESRSISENVTWGKRKSFADGKVWWSYSQMLGYKKGADGKPEIVPEEAAVVKRIYNMLVYEAYSTYQIADILTKEGIKTAKGKDTWSQPTVISIIRNEKYKGDALLQKTFTENFLTHKLIKNRGQVPQYYVENCHEAIIDRETWDLAQLVLNDSTRNRCKAFNNLFLSKVFCGCCGNVYGPQVWHCTDERYKVTRYVCNGKKEKCLREKLKKKHIVCHSHSVHEEYLLEAYFDVLKRWWKKKNKIIAYYEELCLMKENGSEIDRKMASLEEKRNGLIINKNEFLEVAKSNIIPMNQYQDMLKKFDGDIAEIDEQLDELKFDKKDELDKYLQYKGMVLFLNKYEAAPTTFDGATFNFFVKRAVVDEERNVEFEFYDGSRETHFYD